jgi:hypothetical protein
MIYIPANSNEMKRKRRKVMKTIRILVLAAIIGLLKPSNAQVFRMGPQLGRTSSTMTNDSARAVQATSFGASYVVNLTEHVAVEGSVDYMQKGGKWFHIYDEIHKFDFVSKMHYVEAPVLASWFFNDSKAKLRPSVGVGATPAYMAKAEMITQYNNIETSYYMEPVKTNISKRYKRFDIGLTGAAGVNYRMKHRNWISARAGYTLGMIPLYYGRELKPVINKHIFINASWQIPIGIGSSNLHPRYGYLNR